MSVPFSDLRVAAYCPRKLYYRRQEPDRSPPSIVSERRGLAFRYEDLLDASDERLEAAPIEVPPAVYRRRLHTLQADREDWETIADPTARNRALSGRDCHGIVHKLLEDPLRPSIVSPGDPPDNGVWEPHAVQAVAAAKALAWERERPIESAVVEYPAYGVVRDVSLSVRRKAAYRAALRAVRDLDGPPGRLDNQAKCSPCEYVDQCGVRTRTLRSLLGG